VPATLPQLLRSDCLHALLPLDSSLANPPPATALRATAPARSTHHHRQRIPGVCKYPPTAQLAPDARSVQLRHSDVSCVILPRLDASDAAPPARISLPARTTAAPRLARRRTPTTHYSPARTRLGPQHTASSAHSRRSQAPAHSAAARRCTQRTTEVQRRQLRHPSEARCQRRCPSCSDPIVCTHRRPSGRPSQNPHHPLQPRAQPPHPTARIIIHARPAIASTRSQRSWPPIHAAYFLGPATSAAPSLRDSVPTTLPQLLRCHCLHAPPPLGKPLAEPPPPTTASRPTAPARSTHHHPCTAGVRKHPLTAQLPADARSVPPRFSDVNCVILTRLGANDAAPAAPM
jgi:hypothetical protein